MSGGGTHEWSANLPQFVQVVGLPEWNLMPGENCRHRFSGALLRMEERFGRQTARDQDGEGIRVGLGLI